MNVRVPFSAPLTQLEASEAQAAIGRVVRSGRFILGPELEAFETEFAAASRVACAIGVGSGTDALALALRAMGIGPGCEVITSPFSAGFTALAIIMAGARPVFADIDPQRLTLSPAAALAAVTSRTAALIPVHLYGQAADMPALMEVASRHGLVVIEDACQAHLATCAGRPVGTFGAAAGFSFYPTKNLGALGDAGAVVTGDASIAAKVRRLRNGGQSDRCHHEGFGVNSRLDEIQAAVLRSRLHMLVAWTARRRVLAAEYRRLLIPSAVTIPPECDAGHVYHLFPAMSGDREGFQAHMTAHGVVTLAHYPTALTKQPAFVRAGVDCPVAENAARGVCSLPLYPGLSETSQEIVAAAVKNFGQE